jgi:hypothetical protein|nr:MAG TPA: hypothetical protein [Bacteriophage sp.]
MNNPPIVELQTQGLAENTYRSDNNIWSASNLIQWCKEKEYTIFDLPLAGIDLSYSPWTSLSNVKQIANHFKRVQLANLDYPVILDDHGYIADGWHRIVKALVDGKSTIKAIRIQEMPQPDGVENDN